MFAHASIGDNVKINKVIFFKPAIIHTGLQFPAIPSLEKLKWNFWKENWCLFSVLTNKSIPIIPINSITTEDSYID